MMTEYLKRSKQDYFRRQGYASGYQQGRADAIEEYKTKLNREIHLSYSDDLEIQEHIEKIAEQLKENKNER